MAADVRGPRARRVSIPSSSGRGLGRAAGGRGRDLRGVSIPSSSGRGLGPGGRVRDRPARVSQSLLRQGVALAFHVTSGLPSGPSLNPFFVRAWPWPPSRRCIPRRGESQSLLRQGVALAGHGYDLAELPTLSQSLLRQGVALARSGAPSPPTRRGLNPFFVRAWPWPRDADQSHPPRHHVSIPSSSGRGLGPMTFAIAWLAQCLNPFFVRAWPWPRCRVGAPPRLGGSQSLLRQGVALATGSRHGYDLAEVSIPSSSGRGLGLALSQGIHIEGGASQSLLRQGVALAASRLRRHRAADGLNPFFVRAWPWPGTGGDGPDELRLVSIPSSSGRGLGRRLVRHNPAVRESLNPFFVRAWPWPSARPPTPSP